MNKDTKQTPVNDAESRYEVTITGDPCVPKTFGARFQQLEMLRMLATTSGLTDCGSNPFQTMKMFHDGEKWVVVLEAIGP